jgi:hypothetical protein
MTADFYPFYMPFLGATATRIINEVKGVNRVVRHVKAAGHDRVGVRGVSTSDIYRCLVPIRMSRQVTPNSRP